MFLILFFSFCILFLYFSGTIYSAAKEIEAAGGKCLPCAVDIRYEDQVQAAVDKAIETFGGWYFE